MTDRDFLVPVVLDGLQIRFLKTGPEELTIEDTENKLRYCFQVIKERSSKKAEKSMVILIKVIKDALQNANLTNEQALAVFSKQFMGMYTGKYHNKAAECWDKKSD